MGERGDGFETRRVQLSAGPLHLHEAGEGDPIVFVHGFGANHRLWEDVAARLAGSNRCILPDWPLGSHPEAMAPDADLSPPAIARLIDELLDKEGLAGATVVGNDSGGAVSQILVTERPGRVGRLVLTNCDCFDRFPPGRFKWLFRAAGLPGGGAALANSLRFGFVRRGPLAYGALTAERIEGEVLDSFVDPFVTDKGVRRDGMKFAAGADPALTLRAAERLPELRIPVLLAWGADDRFFRLEDARRLAELIPDSRLVPVEGARTFVSLDRPGRVAEEIERFLAEHRDSAAAARG